MSLLVLTGCGVAVIAAFAAIGGRLSKFALAGRLQRRLRR